LLNLAFVRVLCLHIVLLLLVCLQPCRQCAAQTGDQRKPHLSRNKFINNSFQKAVAAISRTPDTNHIGGQMDGKSETPFLPYQGRYIRNIDVVTIGFDRSMEDTGIRDKSFGARMGNLFHVNTRKFVIRNNLFIHEGMPVNAFMVADNERFIRSLEFINDARIVIDSIPGMPDSVNITVYTKDLFSIGGGAAANGTTRVQGELYDANLAGMGQRLEFTGLYDNGRTPHWGYGGYYRKNNVGHTYIDATIGHSAMRVSPYTRVEETADYIELSRRLVSPYSQFAGGLVLSTNRAYNVYRIPENLFLKYRYSQFDGWAGYSIAINKLTATNNAIRDRRFFAVRYYDRNFAEVPRQVGGTFSPVFNSSQAIIGQLTFYRQDFYKTQYIYGFGTTEDLPYGYNIAFTAGWHSQLYLRRPYAGVNVSQSMATNRGDYLQFYVKTGGYYYQDRMQDAGLLAGTTAYGRVVRWHRTMIRQYANLSYTRLGNRVTTAPLYLNNQYGLRGFLSDSVYGTQRLSLQLETAFYLPGKLLGFRFAPFPWGDLALITPENKRFSQSALYTSLGAGLRARNENLIFETIEVRAFFFPVAPANMTGFKVVTNANIRFRYRSNYITAPDFIQLNQE
jgi:hypothetical protein